jgi:hypothetical protein
VPGTTTSASTATKSGSSNFLRDQWTSRGPAASGGLKPANKYKSSSAPPPPQPRDPNLDPALQKKFPNGYKFQESARQTYQATLSLLRLFYSLFLRCYRLCSLAFTPGFRLHVMTHVDSANAHRQSRAPAHLAFRPQHITRCRKKNRFGMMKQEHTRTGWVKSQPKAWKKEFLKMNNWPVMGSADDIDSRVMTLACMKFP